MVLPSQRKRRAHRDRQEADGVALWSEEVPREAQVKLAQIWLEIERDVPAMSLSAAVAKVLRIQGGRNLGSEVNGGRLLQRIDDNDLVLDMVGAFCLVVHDEAGLKEWYRVLQRFVNEVLEDHRVAYRLVDGELVPIESDELHHAVIEPALGLLLGREYAAARSAYLSVVKEIPVDAADAITDAGTALQETLTALGCNGNALGPLIKSGRAQGLFAAHDQTLLDGMEKFLSWASADRSQTGDAHKVTDASRADAWLMVHIVGALIVRLVDPAPRGPVS